MGFLDQIPAGTPPPGVTPNLIDGPTLTRLPEVFIYVTTPLMIVSVLLRFYARIKIHRQVGIDDYLCALGGLMFIALCVLLLKDFYTTPAGHHQWDIPVSHLTEEFVRESLAASFFYFWVAMVVKASILMLYRRIFRPIYLANVLIWIGIVMDVVFYITAFAICVAACIPQAEDYSWPLGALLSITYTDRCNAKNRPITAASGIFGTILDVYILIIPLVLVSSLRTSTKRKAGVLAIFLTGALACIFSIIGAYYRYQILRPEIFGDISWHSQPIYAMNVGEINVGIMCSCMPVTFVLFKGATTTSVSWVGKLRYFTSGKGRHSNQHSGASDAPILPHNRVDQEKLPEIPQETFAGLRRFMRNHNRTTPVETRTAASANAMLTYASADYDYHTQLKQDARAAHKDTFNSRVITEDRSGSKGSSNSNGSRPEIWDGQNR